MPIADGFRPSLRIEEEEEEKKEEQNYTSDDDVVHQVAKLELRRHSIFQYLAERY